MDSEKKIQLTQKSFDQLKEELTEREGPRRARIVDDIATARAHGDLSENAEYHAAREEQAQNEAKIREIRFKLENAEIVEVSEGGPVGPGVLVTIRRAGDEPETYLIGQRHEKSGEHDVLTPESPIGSALLGHNAGETVSAQLPAGEVKIEIVSIAAP